MSRMLARRLSMAARETSIYQSGGLFKSHFGGALEKRRAAGY
jgi:hypothetical protein